MALEPIEERRVTRDPGMIWENFEYLVRFKAEPPTGQKVPVTLGRGAVFTSQCVAMIKLSVSQKGDLESPTSCDGFISTSEFNKSAMHLFPTYIDWRSLLNALLSLQMPLFKIAFHAESSLMLKTPPPSADTHLNLNRKKSNGSLWQEK